MARSVSSTSLVAHLAVWLAVPTGEWLVGRSVQPSPAAWQWGLEFAVFALFGAAQWRWAREPWLRTLLWPPLVVVLTGLAIAGPSGSSPMSWRVLYVAGLVLLTTALMKDFGARLRIPVALAFVLALTAPILNRALDLGTLDRHVAADFGGIRTSPSQLRHELLGSPSQDPPPGPGGPPIVVISVDTLRADSARTMQSWRRLADCGAWWPAAISTSSWTLPAVATLQTGVVPFEHGADCLPGNRCQALGASVATLAEELAGRGYRTAAFTANPWISRATSLDRGFQTFRDFAGVPPFRLTVAGQPAGPSQQDAVVVIDQALAWLEDAGTSSFYLWVHLLGPHMPYIHSPDPSMRTITAGTLRTGGLVSPAMREKVRRAYDGEVAYNDREVMRLLDALERKGLLPGAVVVLTSDHGEEFWEHGGVEHGHSHHSEVTEVPLAICAPGVQAGERAGVPSLADIAPTVRALAGLSPEGQDLRSPLPDDRIVTTWGNLYVGTMRSARDATELVIGSLRGVDREHWERFDLVADPEEMKVLPVPDDSRVAAAARALEPPPAGASASVNREALRSLGYME